MGYQSLSYFEDHQHFSEESGELDLSLLTRSRPVNMRCDYEQTRKSWLLVKQMYTASRESQKDSQATENKKSFRTIGNYLISHLICLYKLPKKYFCTTLYIIFVCR